MLTIAVAWLIAIRDYAVFMNKTNMDIANTLKPLNSLDRALSTTSPRSSNAKP